MISNKYLNSVYLKTFHIALINERLSTILYRGIRSFPSELFYIELQITHLRMKSATANFQYLQVMVILSITLIDNYIFYYFLTRKVKETK